MNDRTSHTSEIDPLASLFASARECQPNLMDDNFTKSLMNSLPSINLVQQRETTKKGLSFDLLGAMIGIMVAYLFIDKTALFDSMPSLMPSSLVVSPLMMIIAIGSIALSSIVAWWAVEDARL